MAKGDLRKELFRLLTGEREQFHSGQELCEQLGVSRTAVWKEVNRLREQGYAIQSVTNRGYRLTGLPDLLTDDLLALHLSQRREPVFCYDEVDSTNTRLLQMALSGAANGTVVLADRQTRGSGRLGRSFASPGGSGVYLSYLLRPECDTERLSLLTSYAGLAVCEVLEEYGLAPAIKWPNDIIINRRKVCGILTKLTSDAETATVNGAVIGIGVNVTQRREDFPEELQDKAISVREAGAIVPRAELAAKIIERLDRFFFEEKLLCCPAGPVIERLRQRSCTIGSRVTVITPTESREADAIDIAPDAGLVIRYDDGTVTTVNSGEVSVRGLLGYT